MTTAATRERRSWLVLAGLVLGVAALSQGWAALNRSRSMMMHGCAGASRPQDCLAMVPEVGAADIGANRSAITGAHLRLLSTGATRSGFWTRRSADGARGSAASRKTSPRGLRWL